MMARLQLSLLGRFEGILDGKVITGFESNKVRALLAYLAAEPDRPQRRETLAALLWPDWPQQSAMSNLRYALADLRKNLGDRDATPPFLLISRESIQLNPAADVWVDVVEFENSQSAIENQQSAISLYRGPFLEGFSLPDSAPFDEWLTVQRERTQRLMMGLLARQVADHAGRGEYELALPPAWRQLELEPWLEEAHQQVMRLLALTNQRGKALAQYETCREMLAKELHVEPGAETVRVYEAVKAGELGSLGAWVNAPPLPISLAPLPPTPGNPPFKGLQYFDVSDADLFFGREALIQHLRWHVHESRRHDQEKIGFLAVVGASGSGKSSLVRAGLAAALLHGKPWANDPCAWDVHIITPTAHPLEALAVELTRGQPSATATTTLMDDLRADSRSLHVYLEKARCPKGTYGNGKCCLLLVVDQFEELFTLCHDETERQAYLENLLTAAGIGDALFLVIALRADFYVHCAQYPKLRAILSAQQEYIGPMSLEELRRAIEEPARQNGWEFEPGLVETFLSDVGASSEHAAEPGALPLLEHALLETWRRRSGRLLTLRGYAESGGVRGAIAKTAESVFGRLKPDEQQMARRIFLRLTELGEGAQNTRRRAALAELSPDSEHQTQVEQVLKTLADARLVTVSKGTAEVAHEALIREWPALREWLSADRDGLRLHRHLTESAEAWDDLDRDPGELYRGARLIQALEWAEAHPDDLNALERSFLQASRQQADQEAAERDAQRQRELEAAKKLAESEKSAAQRLRRRAWVLAGVLGLALLFAIATIWLAQIANGNAEQARANALQAQNEANTRSTAESLALDQQATAESERSRADEQKSLALIAQNLALNEANLRVTAVANAETQRLTAEQQAARAFASQLAAIAQNKLDSEPDLSLLLALRAVSTTRQAGIEVPWDVQQAVHDVAIHDRLIWDQQVSPSPWDILYSPDGRWLVYRDEGYLHKLDAATGEKIWTIKQYVYGIGISPDGRFLASGLEGVSHLWDMDTGQEVLTIAPPDAPNDFGHDPIFSPDGKLLAVMSDNDISLFDLTEWLAAGAPAGYTITTPVRVYGPCPSITYGQDFSPDGSLLVRTCQTEEGHIVQLWDVASGQLLRTFKGHTQYVTTAFFSPSGHQLLTASFDNTVRIWDVATGEEISRLAGHTGWVNYAIYSTDGSKIASAGYDGQVIVWDTATQVPLFKLPTRGGAWGVTFSPDSSRLALTTESGAIQFWDSSIPGPGELGIFQVARDSGSVSPDGSRILEALYDGTVRLRDAQTFNVLATLQTISDPQGYLFSGISQNNQLLGVARSGSVGIWDVSSGRPIYNRSARDGWTQDMDIPPAFSPDGRMMAFSGYPGSVYLLDLTTWQETSLPITLNFLQRGQFSPDGKYLAVGGAVESWGGGGELWLWELPQNDGPLPEPRRFVSDYRGVDSLCFSPDGKYLAIGGDDGEAEIRDLASGERILELTGHTARVTTLRYSADGRYLVSVSWDNTLKVWEASSGTELLSFALPAPNGFDLAFITPDNREIVAYGYDGYYHRFAFMDFTPLLDVLNHRLSRTWTTQECRKYLHTDTCP
jgi:WD40 repeat protein/DNA-binding SARP family transcriptional activator